MSSRQDSSGGTSTVEDLATSVVSAPGPIIPLPKNGELTGRYVAIGELGQGSMGRVLRAYDPRLQREVAIKEVHPEALGLGHDLAGRLVTEARAMAKLSSPNIVAVHDVDAVEGENVRIVLEYVAGPTLRRWLRAEKRPKEDILRTFARAGRGLADAHIAGVLHRDFKPANVLIGNDGSVKVADFGLAKFIASPETESREDSQPDDSLVDLEHSQSLSQNGVVVGTPRYMAPEQHAGAEVGAAADQYAFCVALWEALAGEPPFKGVNLEKRKLEGPPSARSLGVPRRVAEALARGLSVDPRKRWASMDALLERLELDRGRGQRGVVLGVAAIGAAAVAWGVVRADDTCTGARDQLAGAWDSTTRAATERAFDELDTSYARPVAERSIRRLDVYADSWARVHQEACEAANIRKEQSSEMLDRRMACLDRARRELVAAAEVLMQPDEAVVKNAHEVVDRLPPLATCSDLTALERGDAPPTEAEASSIDATSSLLSESRVQRRAGLFAKAAATIEQAEAELGDSSYAPTRVELLRERGLIMTLLGDFDEAQDAHTEGLRVATESADTGRMKAMAAELLFLVGTKQKEFDDADRRYKLLATTLPTSDLEVEARVQNGLGAIALARGEFDAAKEAFDAAVELSERGKLGNTALSSAWVNLAIAHAEAQEHEDAEAALRHAVELVESELGKVHPALVAVKVNLGFVLMSAGRAADAEREGRETIELIRATLGEQHPYMGIALTNVAAALDQLGRHAEAEEVHRKALDVKLATLGPQHPDVALSRFNVGAAIRAQGEREPEAQAEYEGALKILEAVANSPPPNIVFVRAELADLLAERGRSDEAMDMANAAVESAKRVGTPPEFVAKANFVFAKLRWPTPEEPAHCDTLVLAEGALEATDSQDAGQFLDRDAVMGWLDERRPLCADEGHQ